MSDLVETIKSVGFPIAITIYLIIRLDGLMGAIRDNLTVQTEILRDMKSQLRMNGNVK